MTNDEKLLVLAELLEMDEPSSADFRRLETYLKLAEREIISWRYGYSETKPCSFPDELDGVQLFAVVAGCNTSGAENQTSHSENGISRTFKHSDMIAYIRANVTPYVGVISRSGDVYASDEY